MKLKPHIDFQQFTILSNRFKLLNLMIYSLLLYQAFFKSLRQFEQKLAQFLNPV